ncbi:MAG: hypothetical protein ABIB11_05865, partial [Candidatus Omnitrophota bacterium]
MYGKNFIKIRNVIGINILILMPIFLCSYPSFAETEEITLSTYYPAPYGEYEDLTASSFAIGANPSVPTVSGVMNFEPLTVMPSSAMEGDLCYDDAANRLKYHDGSNWVEVGAGLWTLHSNGTDIYRNVGMVGIGTEEPLDRLHVAGSLLLSVAGNPSVHFEDDDQVYTLQTVGATNSFRLFDNTHGRDCIVVTDTGNVGIGTDNPTAKLVVSGGNILAEGMSHGSYPAEGLSKMMW